MTNLKRIREENGMSQSQLAKKSGVSYRTLQCYEQGNKPINGARAITVHQLAVALGCSMEDIMEWDELSEN